MQAACERGADHVSQRFMLRTRFVFMAWHGLPGLFCSFLLVVVYLVSASYLVSLGRAGGGRARLPQASAVLSHPCLRAVLPCLPLAKYDAWYASRDHGRLLNQPPEDDSGCGARAPRALKHTPCVGAARSFSCKILSASRLAAPLPLSAASVHRRGGGGFVDSS